MHKVISVTVTTEMGQASACPKVQLLRGLTPGYSQQLGQHQGLGNVVKYYILALYIKSR